MKLSRTLITGAAALAACGIAGMTVPAAQASTAQTATWRKQHPATHPTAKFSGQLAYDAATGTTVAFGEYPTSAGREVAETWTWDGTTWTRQHPATSPPARLDGTMAYDAASGTVVLFGGHNSSNSKLADTWTWNGTTWAMQTPTTSPPAKAAAGIATTPTNVVLLDGASTWLWR